jgi:hypothetical protein
MKNKLWQSGLSMGLIKVPKWNNWSQTIGARAILSMTYLHLPIPELEVRSFPIKEPEAGKFPVSPRSLKIPLCRIQALLSV